MKIIGSSPFGLSSANVNDSHVRVRLVVPGYHSRGFLIRDCKNYMEKKSNRLLHTEYVQFCP